MQDRPTSRQSVGCGPGGRCHDDAVAPSPADSLSEYAGVELDHFARRPLGQDDIIQCQPLVLEFALTHEPGLDHHTFFNLEVAGQHEIDIRLKTLRRNIGKKTQPTHIDADDRKIDLCQCTRYMEHCAVTAHHDAKINRLGERLAALTNAKSLYLLMRGIAQQHGAAPFLEVLPDVVQGSFDRCVLIAPEQADGFENHSFLGSVAAGQAGYSVKVN